MEPQAAALEIARLAARLAGAIATGSKSEVSMLLGWIEDLTRGIRASTHNPNRRE